MSSDFSNLAPEGKTLIRSSAPEMMSVSALSSWSNALILFFCIFTVIWVVLYTFNPQIIRSQFSVNDANNNKKYLPDTSRLFVASLVSSLLIVLVIWMLCSNN